MFRGPVSRTSVSGQCFCLLPHPHCPVDSVPQKPHLGKFGLCSQFEPKDLTKSFQSRGLQSLTHLRETRHTTTATADDS